MKTKEQSEKETKVTDEVCDRILQIKGCFNDFVVQRVKEISCCRQNPLKQRKKEKQGQVKRFIYLFFILVC